MQGPGQLFLRVTGQKGEGAVQAAAAQTQFAVPSNFSAASDQSGWSLMYYI